MFIKLNEQHQANNCEAVSPLSPHCFRKGTKGDDDEEGEGAEEDLSRAKRCDVHHGVAAVLLPAALHPAGIHTIQNPQMARQRKKKYKKNTLFVIITLNQGFMLLGSAPDGLGQNRVASGDPGLHQLQQGSAGSGEDQNGVRVSSKRQNKHDLTKQ